MAVATDKIRPQGTSLMGRDFLQISDLTADELNSVFVLAAKLKTEVKSNQPHRLLEGKSLAMIFEKPSTRTRISFEVGMFQLGGSAVNISASEIGMGERETVADVASTISRYVDVVMIRSLYHWTLEEFAAAATVPLINGLSDHHHPCQALADILTVMEHKGDLSKVKISYVGDGNNVCNSLIQICEIMQISLAVATPKGREPLLKSPARYTKLYNDPMEACHGADIIYSDVWISMGQESESLRKIREFDGYLVDQKMFSVAKRDASFMHCLPAHRGIEVDTAILESGRSIVFDQAENRMHTQKAVLALLLGK